MEWNVKSVLTWTTGHFEKHAVDAPRLTAELLLAHALGTQRIGLYLALDRPLNDAERETYRTLIKQRLEGRPTQYLLGATEFFKHRFTVNESVLIPRPETELLVSAALEGLPKGEPSTIVDVGTGSGCIALSIALERPQSSVSAVDISAPALSVAAGNASALGLSGRVKFYEGDLLAPLPPEARFDVIVSNPPYIARAALAGLQREVQAEPRLALDGGESGLELIGRLVAQAKARLRPGGLLAMEIGDDQGAATRTLLSDAGYADIRIEKDYARLDRLALARVN